jgi:hypothetical protein
MPKGKAKCRPQDLCFDEEDVIAGRKQPSPKIKTVTADYRINRESPDRAVYNFTNVRNTRLRQAHRKKSPSCSSDEAASNITVKAAPIIKKRNYNVNWRRSEDRPSHATSWRERASSPSTLLAPTDWRSDPPCKGNRIWQGLNRRRSPRRPSPDKFHKTFTLKLTTSETVELRGLQSAKLYATFPEGTYIIADAQHQGKLGERIFQTNKAVQVPERMSALSTFENSFGKMRV